MTDKQFNIIEYLMVLVKWRKFILVNFIAVCILAAIISLLLPKWYRAETTLMPPTDQTSAAMGLASMLSDLPIGDFNLPGMQAPYEIYTAILESRTVAEAVIVRNSLVERYNKKNVQSAVRPLHDHSQIKISDDGIIIISVEDRDPKLAADIANSFAEELDRINQQTSASQAKSTRLFVEKRLKKTREDLRQAEEALRQFQEEYKTASLPDEVTALIDGLAELRSQQVALEVQRGVLEQTVNLSHPEIRRLQLEIDEFQKQIERIITGAHQEGASQQEQKSGDTDFAVPLLQVPSVGLKLARLTREVKIQEAIFQLLTQQYEQAKIQEARDTPTVQVLDKAVPPERKSRPKRMFIVALWGLISIVVSVISSFSLEFWKRMESENSEDYHNIRQMLVVLRKDMMFFKKKKRKSIESVNGRDNGLQD